MHYGFIPKQLLHVKLHSFALKCIRSCKLNLFWIEEKPQVMWMRCRQSRLTTCSWARSLKIYLSQTFLHFRVELNAETLAYKVFIIFYSILVIATYKLNNPSIGYYFTPDCIFWYECTWASCSKYLVDSPNAFGYYSKKANRRHIRMWRNSYIESTSSFASITHKKCRVLRSPDCTRLWICL